MDFLVDILLGLFIICGLIGLEMELIFLFVGFLRFSFTNFRGSLQTGIASFFKFGNFVNLLELLFYFEATTDCQNSTQIIVVFQLGLFRANAFVVLLLTLANVKVDCEVPSMWKRIGISQRKYPLWSTLFNLLIAGLSGIYSEGKSCWYGIMYGSKWARKYHQTW